MSVALDEQVHREVAFKELLQRHADDPDCRARFVIEAEITGSLEHPGIVPVYGLGEYTDGRPYYAMRFIRGYNLKDAISQFHKTDPFGRSSGRQTLGLRRLLGRFIDVCNAMQYAHSRGVLHRDLKPSNVMLGKFGETLVVDWGLAKPMDRPETYSVSRETAVHPPSASGSAPTQMGSVIGTPAFMSPEQAEGRHDRVGPASDIYSLGVTLYCLLTNHMPFASKRILEVLENVSKGTFPRVREVNPLISPAAAAICEKAMALNPKDRYESCSALGEDIEHWLADEPVLAHQETLPERIGRWMRRHRTWTRAGAAALLVVAVVSITATFLVNKARQKATSLAESNERLAHSEAAARQEALSRLQEARGAVDIWLTGASEALKYFPGVQATRERLLGKAAQDYERFAAQRSDDVALECERGRAYLRLGDVRRLLGQSAESEQAYGDARELFEELCQTDPEQSDFRLELANSRTKLGLLLFDTGRHAEAENAYNASISELRALAKTYPDEPRFRDAQGASLLGLGAVLVATGERSKAEEVLAQAVGELEAVAQTETNETRAQVGLSKARNVLGQLFAEDGRHKEALAQFDGAVRGLDSLVEQDENAPEYLESRAATRFYRASVLGIFGRYSEELEAYRATVADYQALTQAIPDVPRYRESLALTRTYLAQLLFELGRTGEAEAELLLALPVFSELVSDYPQVPRYYQEQAVSSDSLAQVLGDLGRGEEARSACQSAIDNYRLLFNSYDDAQYREGEAISFSHLGQILHQLGEHTAATEAYQKAIEALDELIQLDAEIPSYRNAKGFACNHFGALLREIGETAEAKTAFGRAEEAWEYLATETPAPEYLHNLAWFRVNCADPEFRDPRQAVELASRAREEAPQNAAYCNTLAAAYFRAADGPLSVQTIREAMRLRQGGNARDWFFLAMAQWQLGQVEEAEKSYNQACQWMQENRPGNLELKRIRREAAELTKVPEESRPPKGGRG